MRLRDETVLTKIIADHSLEDFMNNEMMKHATAMVAIKIGELVKNLSDEFRAENPQIPWRKIAGFRDIAAHKYETLNMSYVYQTIIEDFPALKLQIEEILAADES